MQRCSKICFSPNLVLSKLKDQRPLNVLGIGIWGVAVSSPIGILKGGGGKRYKISVEPLLFSSQNLMLKYGIPIPRVLRIQLYYQNYCVSSTITLINQSPINVNLKWKPANGFN